MIESEGKKLRLKERISFATIIYGNEIVGENYKTFPTITDAILSVKSQALSTADNVLSYYKEQYNSYTDWFYKKLG